MKNLLISLLFVSTQAFASGGISCQLKATVQSVEQLGILNGTVSELRGQSDTYQYQAQLEIREATTIMNRGGQCPTGIHTIMLKNRSQVEVGQDLTIIYSFSHDRPGSNLSYRIIE